MIAIGDTVKDRLTGARMEVVDVHERDGVTLYTLTDNHGATTDVTREWIEPISDTHICGQCRWLVGLQCCRPDGTGNRKADSDVHGCDQWQKGLQPSSYSPQNG